jgi:CHAT domain-containing protein
LGLALLGIKKAASPHHSAPLLDELSRQTIAAGITTPVRFSVATAHSRCRLVRAGIDSLVAIGCGASSARRAVGSSMIALERRALALNRHEVDPAATHVETLIGLLWTPTPEKSLDVSISSLEMITRLADDPSQAWSDLAATHLLAAADQNDPRELVLALDAAERARVGADRDIAALFNRALAADLLGLDDEALRTWQDYLAVDSTSEWATDAGERVRAIVLQRSQANASVNPTRIDPVLLATEDPGIARVYGWEHLLGDWGRSVVRNDLAGADSTLAEAELIGRALVRHNADASLLDATRAIRQAERNPSRRNQLARAHAEYDSAQGAFKAGRQAEAGAHFVNVSVLGATSRPLILWAELGYAMSLVIRDSVKAGEAKMLELAGRPDVRRYSALAARVHWGLGTTRLKTNRIGDGVRSMRDAQALFAAMRERDNLGAVQELEAEALFVIGDDQAAHRQVRRALGNLRRYPRSIWRHNALFVLAKAAANNDLGRAATVIEDEDAVLAASGPSVVPRIESRLVRARTAWSDGRRRQAVILMRDIDSALRTPTLDAQQRRRFEFDLKLVQGSGPLQSRPSTARAMLDSVIEYFSPSQNPEKLIPAFVAKANAELSLHRYGDAAADLTRAADLFVHRRNRVLTPVQRASITAGAMQVFDRLALLRLEQGRMLDALATIEQGRISFSADGSALAVDSLQTLLGHASSVAIDYRLFGDRLFIWTVGRAGVREHQITVDSAQLIRTVEKLRVGLERGVQSDDENAETSLPELAQLYKWLISPIALELGPRGSVVSIVPDRLIEGVPFAALFDEAQHEFLTEKHAIRLSATLIDAIQPSTHVASSANPVFVGRDSIDRAVFPRLAPLENAEREAREVAAGFPGARVIVGADASHSSIIASLRGASLFHFAGHAVLDQRHPDRSYLAVPPRGITAAELATLDLTGLRLVVLSGCETIRATSGPPTGLSSIADAFRAARVEGVIGTLWRIDDAAALSLVKSFYESYERSGDPALALRDAQRSMLRARDRKLGSPAVWAAFQLTGH